MPTIDGGATIWARQTLTSDIFYKKPDKWFKIWFYIVNRVNHQDNRLFKRGSALITYQEIMSATKASEQQVKDCIHYLETDTMLDRDKTTRGYIRKVVNYNHYQNLENYETTSRPPKRPPQDHPETLSINKNDKNERNILNTNDTPKQDSKSQALPNGSNEDFEKLLKPNAIVTTDWQYLALDIIEKLNVPDNKKSAFFKACRDNQRACEVGLQYAIDFPNPKIRWNMFFVKYNEVKNAGKNK